MTGTVREAGDGRVVVETVAEQDGNQIVRNAEAELEPTVEASGSPGSRELRAAPSNSRSAC